MKLTKEEIDERIEDTLYDYWARHRYCQDGCQVEGENIITSETIKQLISDIIDTIVPKPPLIYESDFDLGFDYAIDTIHQNKKDLGL